MPVSDGTEWRLFVPKPGDLYRQPGGGFERKHHWWLLVDIISDKQADWCTLEPDRRTAHYEFLLFRPGYPPRTVKEQLRNLRGYLRSGMFELVVRGEGS